MSFVSDLFALQKKVQFNSCRISQRQLPNTKSKHKFSTLAHDQVREQLNAILKGDDGIIGIIVNDAVLGRWMIAGQKRLECSWTSMITSLKEK